jgi:Pyruvate/2-oxoacid:ferredoxin oxidoreductase delta subunit
MSATITVEQDGSTRLIDATERFTAILALLEKGSSLSRTIRVDDSKIEQVEIIRVESRAPEPAGWKPWFPVIDYDRCTNCMQCLSFCLFGVYGVDAEKKIQVQNQDKCKTNCPACSRVCPEAAIMFPKYKTGPINGDAVSADDLRREKMKVDISSLLGGDVFQMLRDRSQRAQSRFSKERDADKALKERQKCLAKLAESGDIAPEVLMALPSADEIQRRAEEAAAKAQAARG